MSDLNMATTVALRRRGSSGHGSATWVRHYVYPRASASRCGLAFPGPEWTADAPSVQGEILGCSRCATAAGHAALERGDGLATRPWEGPIPHPNRDAIAAFNKAVQQEAKEPSPAGTLHSVAARCVFSWSESPTVHKLFQVEKDGDGMWVCARVLATFIPPAGDYLLARSVEALKQQGWAWVPPESNLLRKAFAHSLNTVPAQPESTADADEAFSGKGRRS